MSFTIKCDKCGNELKIVDKGNYYEDVIDFLPTEYRDYWGYTESRELSIYCNNKECLNTVDVNV